MVKQTLLSTVMLTIMMTVFYAAYCVIPRSVFHMLTGTTWYPQERVNTIIKLNDGHQYRVFREIVVNTNPPQENGGVFRVWFYATMSPRQTQWLSKITKLFFVGMPGFRGKMWLVNDETGEFGGIYQFDTVDDARHYAYSYAMGLSKRRSRRGMFSIEYYTKNGETSLFRAQDEPIQPDNQQ